MSLDEAKDNDVVKEIEGITFIVEKKLDREIDGIRIGYRRTMFKKDFMITLNGKSGGR